MLADFDTQKRAAIMLLLLLFSSFSAVLLSQYKLSSNEL